jgi:hypothetical protein
MRAIVVGGRDMLSKNYDDLSVSERVNEIEAARILADELVRAGIEVKTPGDLEDLLGISGVLDWEDPRWGTVEAILRSARERRSGDV